MKSLICLCTLLAPPVWAEDLVVFAAASLKGPLDTIIASSPDVRVSYGSSGTLARQVQQGAPADIVLLANEAWMGALVRDGVVAAPEAFAGNRLVMIGQPETEAVPLEPEELIGALDGGRLAMGFTASVPAGIYGKEALTTLGLWESVSPQIAEVDNVRAALALVARGETPMGIVYRSDAQVVPELTVVATFPAESHAPIIYWGAVTADAGPEAVAFLRNLTDGPAQDALTAAGFCRINEVCE